jgi:integrase
MFAKATDDETDLLHFLLCTGAREQEVQYACWADVDLVSKEYTFREHRDLGFTPKDREEGSVPLSNILVDRLRSRRQRYSKSRLIFPSKDGKPNGHALRIIKSLALRAGANCGQRMNKQGRSCAEHPVCRQIILHKMRKTYATRLHQSGVPARTIQGWLRHSDLATTMLYLAEGEDDLQTREQINAAFGGFAQTGGTA